MGLQTKQNATFLSVSNGKLVRFVQNPTATSVQRTSKTGKIVNEEFYDQVDGMITDIKTRERDGFGKEWQIILEDTTGTYIVSFNYSCSYAASFFKALPNVDVTKKVTLSPWQKEVNGKKKSALYINQGGKESVQWFYTRDEPKGLPQLKKVKVKGVEQWDDSDMMDFFENYLKTEFMPMLKGNTATVHEAPASDEGYGEDDAPF